jgi:hypothetical protein
LLMIAVIFLNIDELCDTDISAILYHMSSRVLNGHDLLRCFCYVLNMR